MKKLLLWLGFDIILDVDIFETQRIVQRDNKKFLQKLEDGNYAQDAYWSDIKEVNI